MAKKIRHLKAFTANSMSEYAEYLLSVLPGCTRDVLRTHADALCLVGEYVKSNEMVSYLVAALAPLFYWFSDIPTHIKKNPPQIKICSQLLTLGFLTDAFFSCSCIWGKQNLVCNTTNGH